MSIDITSQGTRSLTERVAAQIRAVMAYNQIRQSQLARSIGKGEQWLSVRLRGAQAIDLNDLDLIAKGLGVAPVDLFPRGNGQPTVTSRHPVDIHRSDGNAASRPAGRRDHTRPAGRSAPSGPARPPLVPRDIAA